MLMLSYLSLYLFVCIFWINMGVGLFMIIHSNSESSLFSLSSFLIFSISVSRLKAFRALFYDSMIYQFRKQFPYEKNFSLQSFSTIFINIIILLVNHCSFQSTVLFKSPKTMHSKVKIWPCYIRV